MMSLPALLQYVLRNLRVQSPFGSVQRTESGYRLERRTLHTDNFIYVTRGRPVWIIDGHEVPLGPGDLLLVRAGRRHHGSSRTQRVMLVSLHVHARLAQALDAFAVVEPPTVQKVQQSSRLDSCFRGWMRDCATMEGPEVSLARLGWAWMIVPAYLRACAEAGTLRYRAADPLVAALLEEMENRVERGMTLAEVCRFTGYTAQHVNRVFHAALGTTPLKYLAALRMQRAADLLAGGGLSVAGVAQRLGMSDAFYFSRLFRRHQGSSPAEYRRYLDAGRPRVERPPTVRAVSEVQKGQVEVRRGHGP